MEGLPSPTIPFLKRFAMKHLLKKKGIVVLSIEINLNHESRFIQTCAKNQSVNDLQVSTR